MSNNVYTVVENAGMDNETIVFGPANFKACDRYMIMNYEQWEIDELNVDILKDGSTEF